MCFFLFSPGNKVVCERVSETITLLKRGQKQILADILFHVHSGQEVDKMYLIVPNTYYRPLLPDRKSKSDSLFPIQKIGDIRNVTHSFFDEKHEYNRLLNMGAEFFKDKNHHGKAKFVLREPDPNNPSLDIENYGFVEGDQKISFTENPTYEKVTVLNSIDMSVFIIKFSVPLKSGENDKRWLRILFEPISFKDSWRQKWNLLKSRLVDKETYMYNIYGPLDVKRQFEQKLKSYERESGNKSDNKYRGELNQACYSLIADWIDNGYKKNGTEFEYNDWRLHVFPMKYKVITNLLVNGDVRQSGVMPNDTNTLGPERSRCYEWKTGINNSSKVEMKCSNPDCCVETNEHHIDKTFNISFRVQQRNNFLNLCVYIALVVSVLGAVLTIFK